MKKKLLAVLAGVLMVLGAMQFYNPSRQNPPVINDFIGAARPPAPVAAALRAACYDCHSSATVWPWYSRWSPVSWLIASDVVHGRSHLNLSDWPADPASQAKQLDRINEVVDYREMPPRKYTLLHAAARLSAAQRQAVLDWTDAAAGKLRAATNN